MRQRYGDVRMLYKSRLAVLKVKTSVPSTAMANPSTAGYSAGISQTERLTISTTHKAPLRATFTQNWLRKALHTFAQASMSAVRPHIIVAVWEIVAMLAANNADKMTPVGIEIL